MLDFYRTVLLRKSWGLNGKQLATAIAPSEMTLGGLLLHMALVEDYWFDHRFTGRDEQDLWANIPWGEDHDWEFHHAHEWAAETLIGQFGESIGRSRAAIKSAASLDQMAQLTRESIDGLTGD